MKDRNQYIDISKGVAIILVVLGHCIQYGFGKDFFYNKSFYDIPLFKCIYSFHMPLFMLISGYLYYYSIQRPALNVIWRKTRSLIIPLIAWQSLFLYISFLRGERIEFGIIPIIYLHELWFLRALYLGCLLVLFVKYLLKDSFIAYIIIVVLLHFVHNRILPEVFVFTTPYFIIGYLSNKYSNITKSHISFQKKYFYVLWILLGMTSCILVNYFDNSFYVYISKTYIFRSGSNITSMLFINMYRHITAIIGCSFALLSIWLSYDKICKIITFSFSEIGKASLCIYIVDDYLHNFMLELIPNGHYNYFILITESICIIIICYIIYVLLSLNKFTKMFFLGKLK